MRVHSLSLAAVLAAAAAAPSTSCKTLECAPGTIERAGTCAPADETVSAAKCGPFTELQGDVCVPQFPPTTCDPASTTADTDPTTGVTTCIGTGVPAGCMAAFACPAPAAGRQTVCGQIYDLETGAPFTAAGATGTVCTLGATTTGPCSLAIQAFDAISFAGNPTGTQPLDSNGFDIDDCGRFRLKDIAQPSGPLIALGIDDLLPASRGPAGTTQPVGISIPKAANTTTKDLEHFIAKSAMTDSWAASGGPAVSAGIDVEIFRAHLTGFDNQPGVAATKNNVVIEPPDAVYFGAAAATRLTLDPAATVTGANGTVLVTNGALDAAYSGTGGLAASCAWTPHPGASVANVVFVQLVRPQDDGGGGTCAQ